MRTPLAALSRLRPGLFSLQIWSVVVSGMLLGGIAFWGITSSSKSVHYALAHTEASYLTVTIQRSSRTVGFLLRRDQNPDGTPALSPASTARVYEEMGLQRSNVSELLAVDPSLDARRLQTLVMETESGFRRIAKGGSASEFVAVQRLLGEVADLTDRMLVEHRATAQEATSEYLRDTDADQMISLVASAAVLGWLVVTSWLISRRMRQTLLRSEAERQSLAASTEAMARRNEQFHALYEAAVDNAGGVAVSEIAKSAATSARRLLRGSLAAVWLTGGDDLLVAATDTDGAWERKGAAVNLDLARRVIGRGASMIVGPGAASDLLDPGLEGAHSGVLVPLIVRSRVVGVLGCWSTASAFYHGDDRRLLEMLAAQVAPAILAADRYQESELRANSDVLTGLPNRRQLMEDTLERYAPAVEIGRPLSVVMIDIDRFKEYNDTFGHASGDAALRALGGILRSGVRGNDRAYRYGGEEFLLVLPDTGVSDAWVLLERLRLAVQATTDSAELPAGFTISVGIAGAPEHGSEFALLLDRADVALYDSKDGGRNRCTVWSAGESTPRAA